jgi:D-arabinose 1-dehydrogenase-like Zn-dependent alcohol dehydrogenase
VCKSEAFSSDVVSFPAGLTLYSAIAKARLRPGDWLVIPGAGGGLGHM